MNQQIFKEVLGGNVLWQSKCHGNSKIVNYLLIIPLLLVIAFPFTMHFLGFGAIAIVELVLFVVVLTSLLIVYYVFYKWENPNMVYAFNDEGMFASNNNPNDNTYFSAPYYNIVSYTVKQEKNNLTTVVINFKVRTQAGYFGKRTNFKMSKIENFEQLKNVLESRDIHEVKGK